MKYFDREWTVINTNFEKLSAYLDMESLFAGVMAGMIWEFAGEEMGATVYGEPQRGYWLYCREPINAVVRGLPSEVAAIELQPGWNLVGPVADVDATALDSGRVWSWDGERFGATTVLEAGKGYWVYTELGTGY